MSNIDLFASEAREYLQALNDGLLELEREPAGGVQETIDTLFRSAHSLKGMSATMGFENLVALTHRMEDVFDRVRGGSLQLGAAAVDTLFEAVDGLEVTLNGILSESLGPTDSGVPPELLDRLDELAHRDADPAQVSEADSLHAGGKHSEEGGAPLSPSPQADVPEGSPGATGERVEPAEAEGARLEVDDFERAAVADALGDGQRAMVLSVTLNPECLMKSVRVFTIFKALEGVAEVAKSVPSTEDLEEERFDLTFRLLLLTSQAEEAVRARIDGIPEVDNFEVTPFALPEAGGAASRPGVGGGEHSVGDTGAREAERNGHRPNASDTAGANGGGASNGAAHKREHVAASSKGALMETTVRVDVERLDELINLVGELVISRTQVAEAARGAGKSALSNNVEQLDRVTSDLQASVMRLRMVPIKTVFERFPRLVRDLARACDKQVRLVMEGQETELDRSIVNEIADPLVHLLRNSVDHGIESAEDRIAAGKDPVGEVFLSARHEGSQVVIEIRDDGGGMDPARIRDKAIEKGILSAAEADELSPHQLIDLIFQPGFSTAEVVSDISGRGVGMDAVRAAIQTLGGSIEVTSEVGRGTRFIVRLPLTLAIILALMVRVGDEVYAIPTEAVQENLHIRRDAVKSIQQQPVVTWRDRVLPYVPLDKALGVLGAKGERADDRTSEERSAPGARDGQRAASEAGESGFVQAIVVQSGPRLGVFAVDEIIGQQEVVIKSLGSMLGDVKGIAGATILGSGRVSLIMDVAEWIPQAS